MYRNTSMVGLKCQIKPTMMVLFMGTLKWAKSGYPMETVTQKWPRAVMSFWRNA